MPRGEYVRSKSSKNGAEPVSSNFPMTLFVSKIKGDDGQAPVYHASTELFMGDTGEIAEYTFVREGKVKVNVILE